MAAALQFALLSCKMIPLTRLSKRRAPALLLCIFATKLQRTVHLSSPIRIHSYVTILQAMLPTLSQIKDVMKCVEPLAEGLKTLASGPSAAKLSAAFATLDK